jgi:hypothetical protein
MRFAPLVAGIGLLLVGGAWLYRRRRSEDNDDSDVEHELPVPRNPDNYRSVESSSDDPLPYPKIDMSASYLVEELKHDAERTEPAVAPAAANTAVAVNAPPIAAKTPKAAKVSEVAIAPEALEALHASYESEATGALEALDASMAAEAAGAPDAPKESASARGSNAPTHEPTVKLPQPRANEVDTTAVLALHPDHLSDDDTAAREFAFFNPESSLNTTHVMLASGTEEPKPFVERRKNPADVLRQAIEREPERSDLRLKLLELYYTAAAQNRRAFVEAVRQLAKNDKLASPNDWSQIADMAKAIAPDDELFAKLLDKKAVA